MKKNLDKKLQHSKIPFSWFYLQNTASPDPTDKICPELPHCGLNCVLVKDQGGCPVCACESNPEHDATVIPVNAPGTAVEKDDSGIICPQLKCDLHCEHGLVMDENDCTLCQCKPQAIGCPPLIECKKKCSYGYKLNRRGCPVLFKLYYYYHFYYIIYLYFIILNYLLFYIF